MRKDKQKALRLRKTGKSYNEIKELLGVPKSTLSYWLKDIKWSTIIKDDLSRAITEKSIIRLRQLNSIRGRHLSKLYLEAQSEARDEFELFKFHPTFISGISIYWGEGDKLTRHLIRMGNIDPRMIKLFIKFLVEVCGVSRGKIRAHLLLYPDLDKKLCRSFWIKKIGLSDNNFNKDIVIQGRHRTRRVPYGVCNITFSSTYLKKKIFVWLDLLSKELLKGKYYTQG